MKITKSQLKAIIREEIQQLSEERKSLHVFEGYNKTVFMNFKKELVKAGVYHKSIVSNDPDNVPTPEWTITIPYGHPGGGKQKTFKRFSKKDIESAINFWFNNINRNKAIRF